MARVKAPRSPRLAGDGQVGDEGVWGGRGGATALAMAGRGAAGMTPALRATWSHHRKSPAGT